MKWVVYSHTDYLDVLEVFTDYAKTITNKVLLVNGPVPETIRKAYDDIIYYDDKLPYASRLLELKQLPDKYILFTHDIDIVLYRDDPALEIVQEYMEKFDFDRVDLKPSGSEKPNGSLDRITDPLDYPYNVNPSIWKLETFMKIMSDWQNETYRTIEGLPVQHDCLKYEIYRPVSTSSVSCGYFKCLPWYQFLHITHHGKFMPPCNEHMDQEIAKIYTDICVKYLNKSKREFRKSMW